MQSRTLPYTAYVAGSSGENKRITIAVRITETDASWIDTTADAEDRNRSEIIRYMLIYASRNMPKGWKP